VRVYTNEDLERVHALRGETGVLSTPAAQPEPADTPRPRGRGEAEWRREAARVRAQMELLAAQAEELRRKLEASREEGRRVLGRRRGPSESALLARIEALTRRMDRLEADLLERARRDGALPGWLR
jgi:hypothetical protein